MNTYPGPQKNWIIPAIFLMLAAALTAPASCADSEYWSKYDLSVKASDRLSFCVRPEFRLTDGISEYTYNKTDAGITLKAAAFFGTSLLYSYKNKKSGGSWECEDILIFDGEFSWKITGLRFSQRNRLEYSLDKETYVYRNRLKARKNLGIFGYAASAYLEEELFYDTDLGEIKENRVGAGIGKDLFSGTSLEIFYLLDSKKAAGDWDNTNVAGTNLKIAL
ncbi:MAG: DUF2490 domain-containing protein [Elusimicrobia bacterium]|nr:DUF2490 domain-containing protein [Elusimicrobiota bacterium]